MRLRRGEGNTRLCLLTMLVLRFSLIQCEGEPNEFKRSLIAAITRSEMRINQNIVSLLCLVKKRWRT
jgi:hypothetical protein